MYNILVIDDESIIRDGICKVLGRYDCFTIVSAYNGRDALRKEEKIHFDVMIIDIHMPEMDGIEFIKVLDTKGNNSIKIILSGHDEFKYAQEAMKYGVVDYILKPISPRKIKDLGKSLIQQIEVKKDRENEIKKLKKQVENSKPLIKERFFNDLIKGKLEKKMFFQKQNFLGIDFKGENFLIGVLKCTYKEIKNEEEFQLNIMLIKNIIDEVIKNSCLGQYFQANSETVILIFNRNEMENFETTAIQKMEEITNKILDKINILVYGGIANSCKGFENINKSYKEALDALEYNSLLLEEGIIKISDIESNNKINFNYFDEDDFITKIKLGRNGQLKRDIDIIFEKIQKDEMGRKCVQIIVMKIILLLVTASNSKDVQILDGEITLTDMISSKSLSQIKNKIKEIIDKTCYVINEKNTNKNKSIIEKAKGIICEGYKEDISLQFIADQLFISKVYLGQLFKETMGLTVNEYINKIRIRKAKEMLENTEYKIYEIAYSVGYNDQHYFSSIFKKHVGLTPKEYREIIFKNKYKGY